MDLMATIMGVGATTFILGIAIFAALGWDVFKLGLSGGQKKACKAIAIVLVLALTVNLGWWATAEPATVAGVATWDSVCTTSTANATVTGNTILVTYDVDGGAFIDAATGSITLSFAATRTDTSISDAVATASITNYGTSTNLTTGTVYDGVALRTDGSFNAVWTVDSVTSAQSITYPGDADSRTETVALTIVVPVTAIAALADYGYYNIGIDVGGEAFTLQIMRSA